MFLIVQLWVRDGCDAREFEKYEREAAQVMQMHGGRIERAFRSSETRSENEPFEVHIVWFPDEGAFTAYRNDARLVALREGRDALIERTEVWCGSEANYGF